MSTDLVYSESAFEAESSNQNNSRRLPKLNSAGSESTLDFKITNKNESSLAMSHQSPASNGTKENSNGPSTAPPDDDALNKELSEK